MSPVLPNSDLIRSTHDKKDFILVKISHTREVRVKRDVSALLGVSRSFRLHEKQLYLRDH